MCCCGPFAKSWCRKNASPSQTDPQVMTIGWSGGVLSLKGFDADQLIESGTCYPESTRRSIFPPISRSLAGTRASPGRGFLFPNASARTMQNCQINRITQGCRPRATCLAKWSDDSSVGGTRRNPKGIPALALVYAQCLQPGTLYVQWLISNGIGACARRCLVTPPRKLCRRRLCV